MAISFFIQIDLYILTASTVYNNYIIKYYYSFMKGAATVFLGLGIFLIVLGYVKFCAALIMQYNERKKI